MLLNKIYYIRHVLVLHTQICFRHFFLSWIFLFEFEIIVLSFVNVKSTGMYMYVTRANFSQNNFFVKQLLPLSVTVQKNFPTGFFHFPTWKTRGLRCFSLNSRVILKLFEAKPRTISILPENLMKNIEIHVFSMLENEKNSRKIFLDSYRLLDITF